MIGRIDDDLGDAEPFLTSTFRIGSLGLALDMEDIVF